MSSVFFHATEGEGFNGQEQESYLDLVGCDCCNTVSLEVGLVFDGNANMIRLDKQGLLDLSVALERAYRHLVESDPYGR